MLIREDDTLRLWRGKDAASSRYYLVKELKQNDSALWERLDAEAKFLLSLDHPGFLRPLAGSRSQGRVVFDEVQCSLSQYLTSVESVPAAQVANLLLEAATALGYLHERKLLHGSISPESLFVRGTGELVFADFLPHEPASRKPLPQPAAHVRYLAPEMLDSSVGRLGPSTDLYSLGYAAMELLAGKRFSQLFGLPVGANWLAWHADPRKTLPGWREALARVPFGLLEIIAALIEKNPTQRCFQNATQLKLTLERSGLTSEQKLRRYSPRLTRPTQVLLEMVDGFRLIRPLPCCPRGELFLAECESRPGRQFSLRLIDPRRLSRTDGLRQLLSTITRSGELASPGLVPLVRGGLTRVGDRTLGFVVTDYFSRGTLADRVKRKGPLPLPLAVRLIARVARTLEKLHRLGLAHGGIHPGSIVQDSVGKPQLHFFGMPENDVDSIYRAPEMTGPTMIGDVYSLAMTLRTLLGSPHELLNDPVREVLNAATQKEPSKRLRSMTELLRGLKRCTSTIEWRVARAQCPQI
jgi:serine/threonine protein kinase